MDKMAIAKLRAQNPIMGLVEEFVRCYEDSIGKDFYVSEDEEIELYTVVLEWAHKHAPKWFGSKDE